MPAKIVELTVELLVQAVSCPGVWLCPEGEVSLAVFALGCSHRTARLPPAFPLPYRDTFYFRKTFRNACSLNNLPAALAGESIYCELVQWKCENDGRVLAQYLGSVSDVLFPPDICSSDGVDLLMKTTSAFPGILSPKIEISTKVRVDEVWEGAGQRPAQAAAAAQGTSPACRPATDSRRQRTVCHSKPYHDARCSRSHLRHRSRHKSSQANRCTGSDEELGPSHSCSPDRRFELDEQLQPRFPPSPAHPASLLRHALSAHCTERQAGLNKTSHSPDDTEDSYISADKNNRLHESEATAAGAGGSRVARLLESECGARRRGRGAAGAAAAAAAQGGRHALDAGPCVCEICRRYHELFHADRPQ